MQLLSCTPTLQLHAYVVAAQCMPKGVRTKAEASAQGNAKCAMLLHIPCQQQWDNLLQSMLGILRRLIHTGYPIV